ncbi:MAG: Hpt domain-containing protein [Actinomycetes bacterium]
MSDRRDVARDESELGAEGARAVMHQLRRRAQRSNLVRVEKLDAALLPAGRGGLTEEERRRAADVAHQVLGSAGTFGYPQASEVAADLERLLRTSDLRDQAAYGRAQGLLARLRAELDPDGTAEAPG